MQNSWIDNAFFYHIYPLGMLGAPQRNDFHTATQQRLEALYPWLDHIQRLGANALYLGPLFESSTHGYDTADYYHVDRRLGDRSTLANLAREIHRRGMRLVLDGVFNHVGRDFWAFRDLLANHERSPYCSWFHNLDFSRRSPYGDPFSYEGWSGHFDLVKLNHANPEVQRHLFDAVAMWIETFEIDGLRLDAADQLPTHFLEELAAFTRARRGDFWLMGEIVFGDYRQLAGPGILDSATNYEMYKSLYSSHNDRNYFEVAYALNRQFGPDGIYKDLRLYTFADNHDVNRVASSLKSAAHLYPLHILLFTTPGVPSIYYGSEWGLPGERTRHSDNALRPALRLEDTAALPQPNLTADIARLAALRRQSPALSSGGYQQLHVASEQFAFLRSHPQEQVVIAVNAAETPCEIELNLPVRSGVLEDVLNAGSAFPISGGTVRVTIPACWGRILVCR